MFWLQWTFGRERCSSRKHEETARHKAVSGILVRYPNVKTTLHAVVVV
jgi:hypothetical protein